MRVGLIAVRILGLRKGTMRTQCPTYPSGNWTTWLQYQCAILSNQIYLMRKVSCNIMSCPENQTLYCVSRKNSARRVDASFTYCGSYHTYLPWGRGRVHASQIGHVLLPTPKFNTCSQRPEATHSQKKTPSLIRKRIGYLPSSGGCAAMCGMAKSRNNPSSVLKRHSPSIFGHSDATNGNICRTLRSCRLCAHRVCFLL